MVKYYPIIVVQSYILLTLGLVYVGPVVYVGFNSVSVLLFMFCIISATTIGFVLAVNKPIASRKRLAPAPGSVGKVFHVSLWIALAGFVLSIAMASQGLNFNLDELGSTYVDAYTGYERNSGSYSPSFIAFTLASAPTFITTVWGLYYFRRLDLLSKILVVIVTIGAALIFTIGTGKQKQLGDLILLAFAISLIKLGRRGGVAAFWKISVVAAVIGSVAVAGFVFILSQRYSVLSIDAFNVNTKVSEYMYYDIDHLLFRLFGPDTGFSLSVLTLYLTNGYYGLSLTLNADPTWSHFLGSSYSLSVIGERFFGLPSGYLVSYPYVVGVESGWGEGKWYTIFPWFASDFTFLGTIPLFALFAYALGRSWLESLVAENPVAILLFSELMMGAFFIPANNQLMHSPGGLLTLAAVSFLYIKYHRRHNAAALRPPLVSSPARA